MSAQRTYWHLQDLQRKPTEYDIVTSRLLYYTSRGFEVTIPAADWYRRYQKGSRLACGDWESFRDPRATTYTKYTEIQNKKEIYVDGLLDSMDQTHYDERLSPAWLARLSPLLGVLRYPVHGLQMVAAYVGQMAPSGRITITALFQTADEVRRVQRLAYRMRQLQAVDPGFGRESRAIWQDDPAWQPLREGVERLLVTYDWGEALVALNLVLKPLFDELFMRWLGRTAEESGDPLLGRLLGSLDEDCAWHRDWSRALVGTLLADRPDNREAIRIWRQRWEPVAGRAVTAFAPRSEIDASYRAVWDSLETSNG